MRAALALLLMAAGTATAGAALLRGGDRVQAASGWSLTERIAALRIERALPAAVQAKALLSLQAPRPILRLFEPRGAVLLRCPSGADLAEALLRRTEGDAMPGCETQSVDDSGDIRVYDLGGAMPSLCPGADSTTAEEQLDHALFRPALHLGQGGSVLERGRLELCGEGEANCALYRTAASTLYCGVVRSCAEGSCAPGGPRELGPDDIATSLYYAQALAEAGDAQRVSPLRCGPAPASARLRTLISEAVTATTAARFAASGPWATRASSAPASRSDRALGSFFARNPRGICFLIEGVDVERARDADAVARALAFPVFTPEDPRAAGRASPFLAALQRASDDPSALTALLPLCDLADERACQRRRERIAAQLRSSLGGLRPPLVDLGDRELPLHLGATGAFHLVESNAEGLTLESNPQPVEKAKTNALVLRYQTLWPELIAEQRRACLKSHGVCLFHAPWSLGAAEPAQAAVDGDGLESMIGLFARRDVARAGCVRRLFNLLAAAPPAALTQLQDSLRAKGDPRRAAACDPRARSPIGLVPRARSGACAAAIAEPFGAADAAHCAPLSLAYVEEEPWAAAAARISAIAAGAGMGVVVYGVSASEVRAAPDRWDVLLSIASNYLRRASPTLSPLLEARGVRNLSGGRATSDEPGAQLLARYDASILDLQPGFSADERDAGEVGDEPLRRVEEDVARRGPAPIYPLAFVRASTAAVPLAQAAAALDPWFLAGLPERWGEKQ